MLAREKVREHCKIPYFEIRVAGCTIQPGLPGFSFTRSRVDSDTTRRKGEDLVQKLIHRLVPNKIPTPHCSQNLCAVVSPGMRVDGLSFSDAISFFRFERYHR